MRKRWVCCKCAPPKVFKMEKCKVTFCEKCNQMKWHHQVTVKERKSGKAKAGTKTRRGNLHP